MSYSCEHAIRDEQRRYSSRVLGVAKACQHTDDHVAVWQLDDECSRREGISFNNVDLRVASDGMSIVAMIDEVYNETEFREL